MRLVVRTARGRRDRLTRRGRPNARSVALVAQETLDLGGELVRAGQVGRRDLRTAGLLDRTNRSLADFQATGLKSFAFVNLSGGWDLLLCGW